MSLIIWVDSDPYISSSANPLRELGCNLKFFNETQDCLDFITANCHENIFCIITSMMERGGRKEKGLMNAFEMVNQIRLNWRRSYSPFLVMITCSADRQQCLDLGFDIVVYGDRKKMQDIIIKRFRNNSDAYYKQKWREPSLLPCLNLRELAKQFLNTLNLNYSDMDPFADHCFCENCEPKKVWYRGEPSEKYVLPTGFYRYGIKIRDEYIKNKIKVYNWNVAYHGTRLANVKSIVEHKRIMFPGDTLNNGKKINIRCGNCFGDGKPTIYVTPSIKYAFIYSTPENFNGRKVKVIFQCRVKPGSFKKHKETLGAIGIIDEHFPNEEIEWVTQDREAVVPYGLLIGFF